MRHGHDLGRYAYALSAVFFGVIGLWSRDFAGLWQPLDNLGIDFNREIVATAYAVVFLVAGLATFNKASAGIALLTLAVLHCLAMLGWIPRVVAHGAWTGLFEMLSLTVAGVVGSAQLQTSSHAAGRTVEIGRAAFAVCLLVFGVSHFVWSDETARMVPAWLPASQMFWAYVTGALYVLAGLAMAARVRAALAGYLAAAMMIVIDAFVWLPMLIGEPTHFNWSGNAITLAMATATWLVADAIAANRDIGPASVQAATVQ